MKLFDAEATRRLLPMGPLIEALRATFIAGCEVPLRHTHTITGAKGPGGTMLLMPAWSQNGLLGVKTVMVYPSNAARGLPGLHATYMLYDASTGVPLALMDGDEITSRRTAAASALAASLIVQRKPQVHLVVGVGRVGQLVPEAYREVLPAASVVLWARRKDQAREAVEVLIGKGIPARVSTDLEADVRAADIVTCATLATAPVVQGAWLKASAHLDLIGSFAPAMREADDACFMDAAIYVDTDEAFRKSGDLLGPMSRGVFTAADIKADLAALCRGAGHLTAGGSRRTVFKSVGTALEDLAAATLVMQGGGSAMA